ncbi:MAG: family 78 glycoside hydrolase catalytic domain [Eubacteriales bacterium]|nr:family 78 glycoside hydrolase catalytic domain [Eubacteriales bacterium]
MIKNANWITSGNDSGDICPVFCRSWKCEKEIEKAELTVTALGVYTAVLNGTRVGEYVLAPGWTAYGKRLQYQIYDITDLIHTDSENTLKITVGKGWMSSPMPGWFDYPSKLERMKRPRGIIGELHIQYADHTEETIYTDENWICEDSPVRFSEIYDGESYDARLESSAESAAASDSDDSGIKHAIPTEPQYAAALSWSKNILIPQEGEEIREMERVAARRIFRTPKGELLVDFGQEVTGYVEFSVNAEAGEQIRILHGEMLDKDGNFYNANYRSANAEINYICREGKQTWHPQLTFFGFRYICLKKFPGEPVPEQFTAIEVRSDIRQTGSLHCGNKKLNQLFSNIFWGQKDNFLDVPTDCPQRDERLGWTGDAQVFVKTASYNYDVEKFFRKWLHDLAADQRPDGSVGQVIPDYTPEEQPSAAWGDAAVICPWQIYLTYGNTDVLRDQFESMKKWVDYITATTTTENMWTGAPHCFGDWLGLDAPSGSYKGSTRDELICTAFYAYSTSLLVKAGHVLRKDMSSYEVLHTRIVSAFQKAYPEYLTQTECVLAVQFGLAADPQKTADQLADMVVKAGTQIRTGFVGTPYILHVLSDYGHADIAYDLLLREEYPSWLFSVNQGATTIWEHWDGIMQNGEFWSTDMNSFNHYAYGSVADWVYEKAAGIQNQEDAPGFARIRISPIPDARLRHLTASINTRHGKVSSSWKVTEQGIRYEIDTPVDAEIVIGDQTYTVTPGIYTYWS